MDYNFIDLLSDKDSTNSRKYKLQTPIKCTTPRKGPLELNTTPYSTLLWHKQHCLPLASTIKRVHINEGDSQRSRPLTRFPVLMTRRPIDELGDQIRGMSCQELQANASIINLKNYFTRGITTPRMPPLAPVNVERLTHTHSTDGPMEISITVTRHSQTDRNITPCPLPSTNYKSYYPIKHKAETSIDRNRTINKSQRSNNRYQSFAPMSLNAMVTQLTQPITPSTYIAGKGLFY